MSIRWFLSPVEVITITDDGDAVKRSIPKMCIKDRYPCLQWGCAYSVDKKVALVRFVATEGGSTTIDAADIIEELVTAERWEDLYSEHPEFKNRWSDQP